MIQEIESCGECPFHQRDEHGFPYCYEHRDFPDIIRIDEVLHDCPLKEEPITIKLKEK